MSALLLRGGSVYSDADPFATALLVQDGAVAWLGDEDGARVRERGVDVIELEGALVTPAFADAGSPTESPAALAGLGVVAVVAPIDTSVRVLDPRDLADDVDLAALVREGVPLALGTAAGRTCAPWELLRHALAHGLSARAAFLAHTRGVWRAAGVPGPARLSVGAPATFVVWEPRELVVQVADLTRSAWSADERGGVPPLPRLAGLDEGGWTPPGALLTVSAGVRIHDTGRW